MGRRTSVRVDASSDDPRAFVADALRYARMTAETPDAASLHARLDCERFVSDYDAAKRPDSRWTFDETAASYSALRWA